MSVKGRIPAIRLMEKLVEKPVVAEELGLIPANRIVISSRQDKKS